MTGGNTVVGIMNKREMAQTLRAEVTALEDLIQKLKARSNGLKAVVLELEEELDGRRADGPEKIKPLGPGSKFQKMVDRVFGETPRPPKR